MNRRLWYGATAISATAGLILRFTVDIFNLVTNPAPTPGLFGPYHAGVLGSLERVSDSLSYFTIWSNIAIAVVAWSLWRRPDASGPRMRFWHNTAVIMIVITGILYALLIAPKDHPTSWNVLANALEHYSTPVIALIAWVASAPRGWLAWRNTLVVYVVPMIYLVYTVIRGAITHTYPYGFFNIVEYGYRSVLLTMVVIIFGCYAIIAILAVADRAISRRATT